MQFPVLYSRTLLFIHPIHISVHLLTPKSQSFPPPLPTPCNHKSILYVCECFCCRDKFICVIFQILHISDIIWYLTFFFLNKFMYVCMYLFIFGHIGSLLLRVGFLQLRRAGATLCCGAWASHHGGFSCCGAQALGVRASVVVVGRLSSCGLRALEHRLSSCGVHAQLLRGMWDLPGSGLETMSPALADGFPTTAPPGKSRYLTFLFTQYDNLFSMIRILTS